MVQSELGLASQGEDGRPFRPVIRDLDLADDLTVLAELDVRSTELLQHIVARQTELYRALQLP